ncbi:hypothetical protein NA56DRAFT_445369 [Hyaloscypha hepaticicola]|uniref:Oxidase ustYa n=1 Tax=Hyaloscypha hepaticicola TaxID=2082293 RepID=A0A2J6PGF3_9HELO|nr:hypothetical protein NA56DRAFT_445369 [Hyaloscypha hepaticicola]
MHQILDCPDECPLQCSRQPRSHIVRSKFVSPQDNSSKLLDAWYLLRSSGVFILWSRITRVCNILFRFDMSPQLYDKLQQDEFEISKSELPPRERENHSSPTQFQSWKLPLLLFITAISLSLNLVMVAKLAGRSEHLLSQAAFFPHFPMETVTFTSRETPFYGNDSAADQAWNSMVPIGSGYLRVPNPRRYGLAPSKIIKNDTEGSEIFQASVIHQLHCVGYFRAYILAREQGIEPNQTYTHIIHCIDYVRQAILCTADTTLEGSNAEGIFSGTGAIHQCRNWNAVKKFLVEKRANDFERSILHT